MQSNKIFQNVGNANPGRSVFDLSYGKIFNCDMGKLIPVLHDEMVPGDIFEISNEAVIRMQPLVAPVLHQIDVFVHYFFVPYRLLWDEWEQFITGGEDGQNSSSLPRVRACGDNNNPNDGVNTVGKYTLWDYFGFPTQDDGNDGYTQSSALPIDFPWRAYGKIFNEWYRAEEIQDPVPETNDEDLGFELDIILPKPLNRNWEKDYFTSALLSQQRGTPVALPVTGTIDLTWDDMFFTTNTIESVANNVKVDNFSGIDKMFTGASANTTSLKNFMNSGVAVPTLTSVDVADLRLAMQIQRWMERNARAGARYVEFLQAHFGVSPNDSRLQRPEYIGGSKQPIVVSEVLQTSSTDATSPQGNLAGHGLSASGNFVGRYRAEEYGIVMGLMSIMPRPVYQNGVNRQWLRQSRYDFYHPEFANLSEQEIMLGELWFKGTTEDNDPFGFIGRYDEMRTKQDLVCADMRDTLDYWHISRQINSKPALNETFLKCEPRKDIFAVQDEPGFIVHFQNQIKAIRPLPIMSEPGRMDH